MEGSSSGEENANLCVRGVEEGRRGEQPDPSEIIELLDVFGEDGLRSYLLGSPRAEKTRKAIRFALFPAVVQRLPIR